MGVNSSFFSNMTKRKKEPNDLEADQGFPDIAFLFSSHEPLYECLGGGRSWGLKNQDHDFWYKFFKSNCSSLSLFLADPRHRKWLGGVYLFGTDGLRARRALGPTLAWGSSF